MTDARFKKLRLVRMLVWSLLMCGTAMLVGWYDPRKAVYVPCIFLALMVPMVLLPLENKKDEKL